MTATAVNPGFWLHHAQRVAGVGAELVEETQAERFAALFFVGFDGAEFHAGPADGFFFRDAPAEEIGSEAVDVETELGVHFGFDAAALAAESGGSS